MYWIQEQEMKSRDRSGWCIRVFSATLRGFGAHSVHNGESIDVFKGTQDVIIFKIITLEEVR